MGRGRRSRDADRAGNRGLHRDLRQDLSHRCAAGSLAVRLGRAVHRRDPVHAQGRNGSVGAIQGAPGAGQADSRGMKAPTKSTSALLYLSGVTVSFDGFRALNNLSLLVEPGEMRAIIGPNGAGKTTMMDVVTGKTRPDEGEVVFDGRADLTKLDESAIATLGIGRKFQKPTVFENHTVRDN